jgi:predicted nucleic acid-binding protein
VIFWDASAIVPLCLPQIATARAVAWLERDEAIAVWAWTPVECASAFARLEREQTYPGPVLALAASRLAELQAHWTEVDDIGSVRQRAMRCLRLHPLRAADAGQLAAALLLVERIDTSVPFATLDARLAEAARREGLVVPP